jgi:hypothetical protein
MLIGQREANSSQRPRVLFNRCLGLDLGSPWLLLYGLLLELMRRFAISNL